MTMVSTGPISLAGTATSGGLNQSIEKELGGNGSTIISFNDAAVRTLLGVSSGAINLNTAYGKSNLGPFVAGSSGASGSSSNAAGPPVTVHVVQDQDCDPIHVVSGGPTSGSFTYAWTVDSADSGVTMSNLTTASPHAHYDYFVPQQSTGLKQATMHCLMTDTVSGLSYTLNGVVMQYSFTNNTG